MQPASGYQRLLPVLFGIRAGRDDGRGEPGAVHGRRGLRGVGVDTVRGAWRALNPGVTRRRAAGTQARAWRFQIALTSDPAWSRVN